MNRIFSTLLLATGLLAASACSKTSDSMAPAAVALPAVSGTFSGAQESPAVPTSATGSFAGTFDKATRELVMQLFPDQKLAPLEKEHAFFKSFYTLAEGKDRQNGQSRPLELEGVSIKNRTVLIYSKNDMVTHLKQVSDPFGNGYDAETCRKLLVNVVSYALQN